MSGHEKIIAAVWRAAGLPPAAAEFRFHPARQWRFDFAWPAARVAVEVQGGIWTRGRHTRGAALLREWEKLNTAAALGWRILYCAPGAVLTTAFAAQIRAALEYEGGRKTDE